LYSGHTVLFPSLLLFRYFPLLISVPLVTLVIRPRAVSYVVADCLTPDGVLPFVVIPHRVNCLYCLQVIALALSLLLRCYCFFTLVYINTPSCQLSLLLADSYVKESSDSLRIRLW
jgi:hypothetical protein